MKKINILLVGLVLAASVQAQNINKLIKEKEVRRIETTLAARSRARRRAWRNGPCQCTHSRPH